MAALKPKTKPAAKGKSKPAPAAGDRPVVYPELTVCGVKIPLENTFITREQNLELIGWEAEETEGQFGQEYDLIDHYGKHVRLLNNAGMNREFRRGTALKRQQDFLSGKWVLNGETGIIGKHGSVLSLQHRGAGYELAWQMWEGWKEGEHSTEREEHYKAVLPEGPVFQSLVVYGIEETPAVTRTLDYTDPRTEADVIHTSGMYGTLSHRDRSIASKVTAAAVKLLWERAGQDADAWSPIRTNSEVMDFLDRHPHVRDAVVHVVQEDGDRNRIRDWLPLGTAAGLLYLMGASESDKDKYLAHKSETSVNWKLWKKAKEFWTMLASGDEAVQALNKARRPVAGEPRTKAGGFSYMGYVFATGEDAGGSREEKIAVLVKAWNAFSTGTKITPSVIKLEYAEGKHPWNDDGYLDEFHLVERPVCGGIDLSPSEASAAADAIQNDLPDDEEEDIDEPNEEEQAAAEEAKKKAGEAKAAKSDAQESKPQGRGKGKAEEQAGAGADILEQLAQFRNMEAATAHPGAVLLIRSKTGFKAYEDDAKVLSSVLGLTKGKDKNGLLLVQFDPSNLEAYLAKLHNEGKVVLKAEYDDAAGEWTLAVLQKRQPPKAPPKPLDRPSEPAPAPAPVANGQAGGKKLKKRPVPLKGGIG